MGGSADAPPGGGTRAWAQGFGFNVEGQFGLGEEASSPGRSAAMIFVAPSFLRLMPYTDPIVLGLLLVSLIATLVYQWRRGLRGGRLAVVAFAMFYGLAVIVALSMHTLDVFYGWTHHLPSMTGKPFAWDWHTYSLLLFGVSMVWLGVRSLRAAMWMGLGEARARAEFLGLVVLVLVIVLPIISIQPFFGVIASVLSALALLVVGLGGRGWSTRLSPADSSAPPTSASRELA
jgi:hypothetical protein